jgi:hypothetical protein
MAKSEPMRTPPASPAPQMLNDYADLLELVGSELAVPKDEAHSYHRGFTVENIRHAAAALAAAPSGAQLERIKELAREEARSNHVHAWMVATADDGRHLFTIPDADDHGFTGCPHPDCALFTLASPETQP